IGDAGGNLHLERLAVLALQRDGLTLHGGGEVERGACRDVRALLRTAEAAISAARLAEAAGAEAAALTLVEHREDVLEVGIALTPPALTEPAEHVVEAARAATARGDARARAHRPDLVVLLALLGVREHRVSLADLLERRLRLGIALIGVRMILPGQLAV